MKLHKLWKGIRKKGKGISILVPFHCNDPESQRAKNWTWLKKYWHAQLPSAEIVMGTDARSENEQVPFSKACAVNDAASRATGDVFVIVDADGYIGAEEVLQCVEDIRTARKQGKRLWFVPYRKFYRLNEFASNLLLESSPKVPKQFSTPPLPCYIQSSDGSLFGHWYGAVIQIMPREAFYEVGGWDERFRSWGGEDHAAMRATDTLWWPHKTLPGQVLHVWHPMISPNGILPWVSWKERMWERQTTTGDNDKLSGRYYGAQGDKKRMRKLVDEGMLVSSFVKGE